MTLFKPKASCQLLFTLSKKHPAKKLNNKVFEEFILTQQRAVDH